MIHPVPSCLQRSYTRLAGFAIAMLATLPLTSSAAWTQYYPDSKIQVQDANGTYTNYAGSSTSITHGDVRYTSSGGTENYKVLGTAQKRVERRYYDDYGAGEDRRWQANVLFNSPSNGETIHQLFNGTVGPHVLITAQSASGGSVKAYNVTSSSVTIATGVYGVTFKLESKNWGSTGKIQILVNGSLKVEGSRRSGDYYTKYGLYNPNAAQTIKFSSVQIYKQ
jgi:hypothetical protein